jgi:hypothetical protein
MSKADTPPTIVELDRGMKFLADETTRLRNSEQGKQYWALQKCKAMDDIREILRKVRQNQQMTGMSGKRIE